MSLLVNPDNLKEIQLYQDTFNKFIDTGKMPSGKILPPEIVLGYINMPVDEGGNKLTEPENMEIGLPIDPFAVLNEIPVGSSVTGQFAFKSYISMAGYGDPAGMNDEDPDGGVRFILNEMDNQCVQRFAMAHMLGHFFLGHYDQFPRICETKETLYGSIEDSQVEYSASMWASDFLVPLAVLDNIINEQGCTLSNIIDIFNVPVCVLQNQAIRLGHKLPIFGVVELREDKAVYNSISTFRLKI